MFTPVVNAVGSSLGLSALCATIPLLVFFLCLMVFKWTAHVSALVSAGAAVLVAVFAFKMPVNLAGLAFSQGVAFGLFPVVYIIWMAVWIYDLTVRSGRFEDMRMLFSKLGRGDMRVQAMLIGFAFGGLLEALAGFGAPIAIVAAMLLAIGVKPMKAVLVTLVANCAPVAFGAMAIPVATGGVLTNIPGEQVAAMAGRQLSLVALIVPFILAVILDGVRGLRQTWPMALVLGVSFGLGQFLGSNYFSFVLTDVVACLLSLFCGVVFLRFWKPRTTPADQASAVAADSVDLTPQRAGLALFPYVLIVLVFSFTSLWRIGIDVPALLKSADIRFGWPILHTHLVNALGEPVSSTMFNFNWLSTPGTILFICGLITAGVYSATNDGGKYPMSFKLAFNQLGAGAIKMRYSALTIASVMGLAYVMNMSGQTASMGAFLAGAGAIFPLVSPVLGWIGTWVTGSATSANALFAQMQATTADQIGASPTLLVAANTSGASLGKMMSPQTLTIAATAVNMPGSEAKIMGEAWKYSLGLLAYICVIVFLQSSPVLGWMVVG